MKTPKLIKICQYMYHLHRRNFKIYLKPRSIPHTQEVCKNSIHWVGHATTIININNKIIVTDPVTSLYLGQMKRLVNPSINLSKMKIDYILISHGHMDHLDISTLKKIDKSVKIICPRQYKKLLQLTGFKNIFSINEDEKFTDGELTIEAYKANHDGKRYALGRYSLSNSYLIKDKNKSVFFAGDTALTENFKNIKSDIALMPVGCYKPKEFEHMHCNPIQSYEMFKMMDSKLMIPIHYKTYILAQDKDEETIQILNSINRGDIKIIEIGETIKF